MEALDWQALNIALRVGGLRAGKEGDLAMDAGYRQDLTRVLAGHFAEFSA